MRKIWKLCAAAALATAVLIAGCGNNEAQPGKTEAEAKKIVAEPVKEADKKAEAVKPAEEPKNQAVNVSMPQQPSGPICQSCAMPMTKAEDFGTNADKTQSNEYCTHCYQSGAFAGPDMTCDQMIDFCTGILCTKMNMPEPQAREMMKNSIPNLKRWQKPAEQK